MKAGDQSGGFCLQIRDGGILHKDVTVEVGGNSEVLNIFGGTPNTLR